MLPYEKMINQITCPICGREFFPPEMDMWGYTLLTGKAGTSKIKFCSWRCLRKYEKAHQRKDYEKKLLKIQKELAGIVPNIKQERSAKEV